VTGPPGAAGLGAAAGSPSGPDLTVRGGAGGTAGRLDDLEIAGRLLRGSADAMAAIAGQATRIAADPASAATAPLSPVTWWEAERRLAGALTGRSGAVWVAARYAGLAAGALAAVVAYRAADATSTAVLQAVEVGAGEAVGRLLAAPAMVGALAVLPVLPRALPLLLPELTPAGPVDGGPVAGGPVAGGPAAGGSDPSWSGPGWSGPGPAPSGPLVRGLAGHPVAVEHLVAAAPGLLRGLTGSPLLLVLASGVTGRPLVPLDVPGAAGWIGSVSGRLPYLRESTTVTLRVGPVAAASPPRGLGDLLAGVAELVPTAAPATPGIGVLAITGAAGRRAWVVQIPGTQDWSPRAGTDPFDLTGDVHALAGEPTAAGEAVVEALAGSGARPGEPVLLVGHSEGGLVAAQLAAEPAFRRRFSVTHVVTVGSPVACAAVPEPVAVLSLEHEHDLVPRLAGASNPDRPDWVTVTARAEPAGAPPDAALSHDLGSYLRTAAAVDASDDPGLRRWRAGLAPFLGGTGVTATRVVVTPARGGAG
jgi:hypothetical protein